MHIQPSFKETRDDVLHALIQRHPLATVVVHTDELVVNHFPLFLSTGRKHGVLQGHIPKSNPLWQNLDAHPEQGLAAVAIFHGPQAYVTPSWYPSKAEHGKVVPTWNYAVVHAQGQAVAVHDSDWLFEHINKLTSQQEASQDLPWKVSDAPPDYSARLVDSLVGIELPIDSIVGKWKVSQNRSAADQAGVAAGLRTRGTSEDLAMEALVKGF